MSKLLVGWKYVVLETSKSHFECCIFKCVTEITYFKHQFYHRNITNRRVTNSDHKHVRLYLNMANDYLRSGILMVPVPFNLNVPAFGLAWPFGRPKVFPFPLLVWLLPNGSLTPDTFETPGLEVVFKQNVLDDGAASGLCLDWCLFSFGGT